MQRPKENGKEEDGKRERERLRDREREERERERCSASFQLSSALWSSRQKPQTPWSGDKLCLV